MSRIKLQAPRRPRLSLYESLRMFDRHFDTVFCAKRPWMRRNGEDPVFGGALHPNPSNSTPQAIAKHFLALQDPPRGTLAQMAKRAGIAYRTLYAAVAYERNKRGASA